MSRANVALKRYLLPSLLFCTFGLTSCSKLGLAYRFADGVIAGQADKYFDLSSEQKRKTKELVKVELRGFLKDESPKLNLHFKQLIALAKRNDVTQQELSGFSTQFNDYFLKAISRVEGSVDQFLLMLSQKQFGYYEKKAKEDTQEKQENLRSKEAQRKELKKRFERGFDLIGLDLNSDQEKMLKDFLAQDPYPFDLEIRNQSELTKLFLAAAQNADTLKVFIHQVFSNPLSLRQPEFATAFEAYRLKSRAFQWQIYRSLQDKQRHDIEKKLNDWITQLDELRKSEGLDTEAQKAHLNALLLLVFLQTIKNTLIT